MSRYVLVSATGLVVNVIMWDGNDNWSNDEYTAIQSDVADIGWQYSNSEFIKPSQAVISLTDEQLAKEARAKRNMLIAETDYLLMPDYPIASEKIALVKEYRQQLRNITEQLGFPSDVLWPEKPE